MHKQRYLYLSVQRYLLKFPLSAVQYSHLMPLHLSVGGGMELSAQALSSALSNSPPRITDLRAHELWEETHSQRGAGTAHCGPGELKRSHLGPNRSPKGCRAAPRRGGQRHHHSGETGHSSGFSGHSSGDSFWGISNPASEFWWKVSLQCYWNWCLATTPKAFTTGKLFQ